MAHLKTSFLKITAFILITLIIVSFSNKKFALDGGSIINPNIVIASQTTPPEIKATNASGCAGTIIYQWQQSADGKNFIDIPNSSGASYQPIVLFTTTQFRRRAVCGTDTAYTNNVATIIIQ